jgi:hypothetical protein
MFTKQDYVEYFQQIASVERMMIYRVSDILLEMENMDMRSPLESLLEDEKKHYSIVLGIFDDLLLEDQDDRRKFRREHFLGKVKMKVNDSGENLEGYCVNISEGGICIEFDEHIYPDALVELWIDFFDGRESQHHVGKLAWSVELPKELQIARVTTKAAIDFSKK